MRTPPVSLLSLLLAAALATPAVAQDTAAQPVSSEAASLPLAVPFRDPAQPYEDGFKSAASGVRYQLLATYDLKQIDGIAASELDTFLARATMKAPELRDGFTPAKYPIRLYRVKYASVVPEQGNRPTLASGLVAIPVTGQATMPVLSYQHGTVFDRTEVPSFPDKSMETRVMLSRFASQGYVVVAADYFGRGLSTEPDSYLVKQSTEQACIDMLFAGRAVLAAEKVTPGPLFLSGWSQGGWVTMTLTRKLEQLGMPVAAVATACAPLDIFALTNRWANNYQPTDSEWLPACATLQILAQEAYFGQMGLAEFAIRPEYLQLARDLYAGRIDWPTFRKQTPVRCDAFLRRAFLESGNLATFPYWQVQEQSQAYRWRSHTPIRNYYGEADDIVPVAIARLAEGFHALMGCGPTVSISMGSRADHRATFVSAATQQKGWFDSFLARSR